MKPRLPRLTHCRPQGMGWFPYCPSVARNRAEWFLCKPVRIFASSSNEVCSRIAVSKGDHSA
jgi:hypothetical protein